MKRLLAIAAAILFSSALAAQEAPDALVQRVTDEVIETARHDPAIQDGDVAKATALVEAKAIPHFDLLRLTALAVGKRYWEDASPEQREHLAQEFGLMLSRTFANYLTTLRKEQFRHKAAQISADGKKAHVRTVVIDPGNETLYVDYALENTESGWKAYNVVVAGIDLAVSYREQFAAALNKGGVEGLIDALSHKNHPIAAKATLE